MSVKHHARTVTRILEELKPKYVAEIGIWEGWLTEEILKSHVAGYIKEYWAIDQWRILPEGYKDWSRMTMDDWDERYMITCKLMFRFPNLKIIRLPSVKAATLFPDGYFDFVYIDADHYYEPCLQDLKTWAPKVSATGVLAGHDYFDRAEGRRAKCEVRSAVNDFFGEENIIAENHSVWIRK